MQPRSGLESELAGEPCARRLKRPQSIGLAPGAIQGQHQACNQPLAQGMLVNEPLQFGCKVGTMTECELDLEPQFRRGQPTFLESLRVSFEGIVAVEHVGPSRPAPQRERTRQVMECGSRLLAVGRSDRARYQTLERINIDLFRLNQEHVTARPAHDSVMAKQPPKPIEVAIERLCPAPWRMLSPKRVDELVARDGLVPVHQEDRQQLALLSSPERNRLAVLRYRDRSEPLKPYSGGIEPPIGGVFQFFSRYDDASSGALHNLRGLDVAASPNPFPQPDRMRGYDRSGRLGVGARRHGSSRAIPRGTLACDRSVGCRVGTAREGRGYGGVQRL